MRFAYCAPSSWSKDHRVSSDQPVELARGDDMFTGNRFNCDDHTGIANLQNHVQGAIQPQQAGSTG